LYNNVQKIIEILNNIKSVIFQHINL